MGGAICSGVPWSNLFRGAQLLHFRAHVLEVGAVGVSPAVARLTEDAHEARLSESHSGSL